MDTIDILVSTILLRPYVFILLGFYLIAFISEYTSTRIGIPYGLYHYTGETHGKKLFISNVPFMDSLSHLPGIQKMYSF